MRISKQREWSFMCHRITAALLFGVLGGLLFFPPSLQAETKTVWEKRMNFVKIDRMPAKEMPELAPNHPYTISEEEMEAMLLSLRISKQHLIRKQVGSQEVFLSDEAKEIAPHLVEALRMAGPDEWVVLNMIQKRPFFILRDDRLTLAFLWVEGKELHIRFKKMFAKLTGDYESVTDKGRQVKDAAAVRITLEAGPGQTLSYRDTAEVLLDTQFDFSKWWESVPKDLSGQPLSPAQAAQVQATQQALAPPKKSATERLNELDQLKKDGRVTEKEYQEIRANILKDF